MGLDWMGLVGEVGASGQAGGLPLEIRNVASVLLLLESQRGVPASVALQS